MAIAETDGWAASCGGNVVSAVVKQDLIDILTLMNFPVYGENQTFIYPIKFLKEES
jgi:hypothetical protein